MSLTYQGIIFLILTVALFFIGKRTVRQLYLVLKLVFRHDNIVFSLIAFIFLPGTFLHEIAHYLMAILLLLQVTDFTIFPVWHKNDITLGRVTYYKKDVIRSVLVGVAPLITGMLFFIGIAYFHMSPDTSRGVVYNMFFTYLMFAISTSMYLSKQDLKDIIYVIPILVGISVFIYFFDIDSAKIIDKLYIRALSEYLLPTLNYYLIVSIGIHTLAIIFLGSITRLFKH